MAAQSRNVKRFLLAALHFQNRRDKYFTIISIPLKNANNICLSSASCDT